MLKLLYRFCILNHCLYPHFFDVAATKLSNLIANFSEMLLDFYTKLFLWCSYQSFLENIQLCFKSYPTLLLLDNLVSWYTTKTVKMALPVWWADVCVTDRIAAVYHHAVSAVYPHMADRTRRVVSPSKENNVPRLCVRRRNGRTLVINALCGGSRQIVYAAVGKHPAHIAGTVKARGRAWTAPYIRVSEVFCGFLHERLHRCVIICVRRHCVSRHTARCFPVKRTLVHVKIK